MNVERKRGNGITKLLSKPDSSRKKHPIAAGPSPKKTSKVQARPLGSSLRHKPSKR